MIVKIVTDYGYTGRESPSEETFDLEVTGNEYDKPELIAKTYLKLRKKLRKGMGKED